MNNSSLYYAVTASISRMWAVSLRHLLQMYKDASRLIHVFYWPFLDFLLWGFTAKWVQGSFASDPRFSIVMLTALTAWHFAVRANLDVSTHLLEDIHDQNIPNLFCSPLSIYEWAGGILFLSIANVLALLLFSVVCIGILYHINVLSVGFRLVPFLFSLFISGLAIGFFAAALLINWGRRMLGLIYMMGWFFAPFSGAFYPIHVLPVPMQILARLFPMSYALEGIRFLVRFDAFAWQLFFISLSLSVLFFVGAFLFFLFMFAKSKNKGLTRLSD